MRDRLKSADFDIFQSRRDWSKLLSDSIGGAGSGTRREWDPVLVERYKLFSTHSIGRGCAAGPILSQPDRATNRRPFTDNYNRLGCSGNRQHLRPGRTQSGAGLPAAGAAVSCGHAGSGADWTYRRAIWIDGGCNGQWRPRSDRPRQLWTGFPCRLLRDFEGSTTVTQTRPGTGFRN